jgi:uncharacterized protein (DUF1778 family)
MTASARFDLKMDLDEKATLSRAASLLGVTMAAFVRSAAKEKALELIARESRVTMTPKDFEAFAAALNQDFSPNLALQKAIKSSRKIKRA